MERLRRVAAKLVYMRRAELRTGLAEREVRMAGSSSERRTRSSAVSANPRQLVGVWPTHGTQPPGSHRKWRSLACCSGS
jgi:hypothetical protein